MKSVFFKIFLFCFCVCLFCFSCGTTPKETIDAGLSDSVLAKYKDNPALQEINKKIIDNPSIDSFYRERALIYIGLSDFELAEGDAKRALALDSSTSKNFLLLTDVYFKSNQTRKAKETLERCLKSLPKDIEANLKLAELYYYVKKYSESIEQVNKALEIDKYQSKAYYLKGMNYMEAGDTAKAISSMQTAVEQDNEYYTAYVQLGLLHLHKKNKLCKDYFENALRIHPKSTEALYGIGFYLQDLGKYREASEYYERILSINPKHVDALYNMGALYLSINNNPAQAQQYFTDIINIDQNNYKAWFSRGVCLEKLKDKEGAIRDFKMALKISENYEPAISALNKITGNQPK